MPDEPVHETILELQPDKGHRKDTEIFRIDVRQCSDSDLRLAEEMLLSATRQQLHQVAGRPLPSEGEDNPADRPLLEPIPENAP